MGVRGPQAWQHDHTLSRRDPPYEPRGAAGDYGHPLAGSPHRDTWVIADALGQQVT